MNLHEVGFVLEGFVADKDRDRKAATYGAAWTWHMSSLWHFFVCKWLGCPFD